MANVHDPITYLIRIPIFQWFVVKRGSKNGHPKCMCSTFVEHHGLNSPHNWGGGGGDKPHCFMAPTFLTLKNHVNNMGDQT